VEPMLRTSLNRKVRMASKTGVAGGNVKRGRIWKLAAGGGLSDLAGVCPQGIVVSHSGAE
jgi:hypothetical protein